MSIIIDNVDFENLPAEKYWSFPKSSKADRNAEIRNFILSNQYIGARKIDGAYFRFIKGMDGTMRLQPRSESVNGGYLNKIEWVPHLNSFFESLPNGTCLLGEIYFEHNEGSKNVTTIMGCLKDKAIERQKDVKLSYYVFDVWAWAGKSYLKENAETRFNRLAAISNTKEFTHNENIKFAKYYIGPALWDELARVRLNDGEGIVITKINSIPEPGKRTARKTLKIKKELDNPIDCFLTGNYKPSTFEYKGDCIESWQYWYETRNGEKKKGNYWQDYRQGASIIPVTKGWYNGWASAVEIGVMDGEAIHPVGWISGVTDEVKDGIVHNPEKWKYRVVKVNAMSIEPDTKALRHGRIIEWRAEGDKDWRECGIDQLK